MTGEQLYVSHAPGDLELVQDLFSTVKNFPFGVHIALEEVESGRSRKRLEGRLANSNIVVAVLTADAAENRWINQEMGYAVAKGIPVLPVYDESVSRRGFVSDVEGITIDRNNLSFTIFNLLCRLRSELAPLGALSVPNWYIRFPCTIPDCGHPVTLELEQGQTKLWKLHKHGKLLTTSCEDCGSTYFFNPATIGFVSRDDGASP
ncbi:toll/interleukin-1 receptor domain-containing protein [Natrinema longum]|uniref:Toll/interleukin-1 receptor domain-containing protein n=1 Tax=Natrinema longum TaxID=370324 RepID=A0A8A2U9X7_9EURY|nr:toll/interleukin-1 receptor domain-containing protein [Natrinema longum]MBZ6496537.1 toll/interleukin-1 receptor domain-containing protein [Natrinema longum]QSW85559.1 toll/interleukin-1 receptor domain-containing protein [Natrinema longum]